MILLICGPMATRSDFTFKRHSHVAVNREQFHIPGPGRLHVLGFFFDSPSVGAQFFAAWSDRVQAASCMPPGSPSKRDSFADNTELCIACSDTPPERQSMGTPVASGTNTEPDGPADSIQASQGQHSSKMRKILQPSYQVESFRGVGKSCFPRLFQTGHDRPEVSTWLSTSS